jgi:hypothetical protein
LWKIQVKGTRKAYQPKTRACEIYQFNNGCKSPSSSTGCTASYLKDDYDVLACVALDIEKVMFFEHSYVKVLAFPVPVFEADERTCWDDITSKLTKEAEHELA